MADKRILCVDDHQAGLRTMTKVLEYAGFEVVATANPDAIPNLTDISQLDAIVLDFQLPQTNGVLLAENFKQQSPATPIVLITAYPADVPEHAANFIDAFLCKGAKTAKELPAVLTALIEGKKKLSPLETLREAAKEALQVNERTSERLQPGE